MTQFRADRFATLNLFRLLGRGGLRAGERRIPILMYHSISETTQDAHPYFLTETSTAAFAEQMKYLHDNGYSAISLNEVVALLGSKPVAETKKYVVITFDDGYRDFYTDAFPILNKYGLNATVFLPTEYISGRARSFKTKNCMTWQEVRELRKAGVVFGSHTVSHPQLHSVSRAQLETELQHSKETIENELGERITGFSYPYAFPEDDREFTMRLQTQLKQCGYETGVTTVIGSVQKLEDMFAMKRLPANSCDDPALFQAKLEGDYDWLRKAQYVRKLLKRKPKQAVSGAGAMDATGADHGQISAK
jgi:peptidoglycan/xylan/chitin deacetylase (PgdA/CDA1 family)